MATVSQGDIPAGTYDAIIHGDAVEGASIVGLRVKASKTITTDDNATTSTATTQVVYRQEPS